MYNVYNTAGVVLALHCSGLLTLDKSAEILKNHHFSVPGRMETFSLANGATAVVDYAHTPDALKNILTTLRELDQPQLSAVFGCGGDRDRSKRPLMGEIAARFADKVYITSDNPRNEEPAAIIDEICSGIPADCCNAVVEQDRYTAIMQALKNALPGSIVLIAGKGHEDYQIIKSVKQHFDDREVVRDFLNLN
jgi:UDP-N-acetylmuramoyl-L-alanyl-D-glutamate--2,6-diaminopimelate ligase